MTQQDFLARFITEDIYLVPEKKKSASGGPVIIIEGEPKESEQQFLYKIFASVGLTAADLTIQNRSQNINPNARQIFFFGCAPESKEFYQIHQADDQVLVYCHQLSELATDQEKKRNLWGILQQLFPNP